MEIAIIVALPMPPVDEQSRILAKVDEPMALCDKLETILAAANDASRCLLEALRGQALAPDEKRKSEAA